MNPFSVEVTGKLGKLIEQFSGLSDEQAQELLTGGYFPALREAKRQETLPSIDQFRRFVSGQCDLAQVERSLDCSQLFELKKLLGKGWVAEEQNELALTLTRVDFAQARFETCLREGEDSIKGEEKRRRLKERQAEFIPHGGNQFWALWQDCKKNGENSVLEWLRKVKGITYLDFFGLILRRPNGFVCVLCLCWRSGCWDWHCRWLGHEWIGDFSVVSFAS